MAGDLNSDGGRFEKKMAGDFKKMVGDLNSDGGFIKISGRFETNLDLSR